MEEDNYEEINLDFLINMIKNFIHMFLCVVIITVIVATLWKIGSTGEISNQISNITATEKLKDIEKNNIVVSPLESHSNDINPIFAPLLIAKNAIEKDTIHKNIENSENAKEEIVKINEVSEIKEEKEEVKQITYYEKEKI